MHDCVYNSAVGMLPYHVKPHSGRVPEKGLLSEAGIPGANCSVIDVYGRPTLFFTIGSLPGGPGMISMTSISVAPRPSPG